MSLILSRGDELNTSNISVSTFDQGQLLRTRISYYIDYKVWDEITLYSQTAEDKKRKNNFTRHFTVYMITERCWD